MGGGLIQLVAYGSQDMYLTGNPQITFFKSVYRRHTNFAVESIKNIFNGTTNFGQNISAVVDRSGDLIHKMYLQVSIPAVNLHTAITTGGESGQYVAFRWLNWLGHILIDHVELTIGGQEIDKHYGDWLHIWNELTQTAEQGPAYAEMLGNVPKLTQIQSCNTTSSTSTEAYTLYIPLQFWFNRHPGLALPIISLQHHDVKINVKFRTFDECIWATKQDNSASSPYNAAIGENVFTTKPELGDVFLYTDYIFLDTAERRRFSQVQHEYLIEQVQRKNGTIPQNTTGTSSTRFKFNHPVKEVIWTVQPKVHREKAYSQARGGRQYFNYTDAWDYSGFTGTPSGFYGPGLKGGKNSSNLLWGVPTVKSTGSLNNSSNTWTGTNTSASSTSDNLGYGDVQGYTKTSSTNLYNERTFEQLFGPALAQPEGENSVGLINATDNELLLSDGGKNPVSTATIKLNGNDRFNSREGFYFNTVQPYQHHTGAPAVGINVYSFSLKPEDYQPSGTCNFSRLDNTELDLVLTTDATSKANGAEIMIYGLNYNVLRIMSGMAGLAYSN